ncbi:dGTP triphosphohydrolase [Aquirufa ecclesiirivi]|uniref:dGTP triphosphohydrolase n=1 Tax=Aquirufa ecclesiirivi TaxID=2715124 RepID=UPI0023D8381A|nr:dNTP triphosphohydrolase [Aquirufa ecclesiirivi]MDF0694866.1 dNTP triphosphohydrolase [Aquirufa ecclesiirivi]
MILNKLFSDKRTGEANPITSQDPRSEFQRDFDRIIFSSSFRRLQNKTQVFPLPGSVFVHNRLTHSLEVASVGRSLGSLIGDNLCEKYKSDLDENAKIFYKHNLYNVISSACLCHDIGNPAFGHSGEDAIASFFSKNESNLKHLFTGPEWSDFINFEGNANAIRVLTQQQNGKDEGGVKLTYSTIASIAKYPCESIGKDKDFIYRKKFGFFQSEKSTFIDVANETQMTNDGSNKLIYFRHPFVWLVEVADDICYNIIDLEDAHRLGIIDTRTCEDLFNFLIQCIGIDNTTKVEEKLSKLKNKNERVAYLRAKSINSLTLKATQVYIDKFDSILDGTFNISIYDFIKADCDALNLIENFSIEHIYNHRSVIEIENAGYNVMYELLQHLVPPILIENKKRKQSDNKALRLIPSQFLYDGDNNYKKVLGVIDYVSGMTDNYATDLYRKIKGIDIGMTL